MERYKITVGDKIHDAIYDSGNIIINGKEYCFATKDIENDLIDIQLNNSTHRTYCSFKNNQTEAEVWVDNHLIIFKLEDARSLLLNRFKAKSANTLSEVIINAPMPGLVKMIEISKDDLVKRGQGLVILEAMKMENEIKSPVDGRIKEIRIENNISVEKDQILIIIEAI